MKITLLSPILPLQLPNFVSCVRDKPSHMTQNLHFQLVMSWCRQTCNEGQNILTHLGLVSHACIFSSHFPDDACISFPYICIDVGDTESLMAREIWKKTYLQDDTWRINSSPLDKMGIILQTIFSYVFSWMKSFVFWLNFHWSLFLRVQLTINSALV